MGKYSNIILVDNNENIIDSLKHFSINSGSYRNVFPGEKYKLPNSDKLDFLSVKDSDEFFRILENNSKQLCTSSISKVISSIFTGISKSSIISFEHDLNLSDEINENSSNILFKYILEIISNTNKTICVNGENEYHLKNLSVQFFNNAKDVNKENDLQINFALDDLYSNKEEKEVFENYRNNLLKLILTKLAKLNVKLDIINNELNECKNSEKYRLYGELITSNLYKINDYNIDSITLENYYDNNKPITIKLDSSISPSANAKRFFKKYKKLKTAKDIIDNQKISIVNDIDYLESIVYEINNCKNVLDIDEIYGEIQESNITFKRQNTNNSNNSKKSKSKKDVNKINKKNVYKDPLKFEIDGFTVLIGKNNRQNDFLTTKLANKEDIWFHVKDFHGSHVILKTENKTPSQDTINKCAKLAKEYSRASNSSKCSS